MSKTPLIDKFKAFAEASTTDQDFAARIRESGFIKSMSTLHAVAYRDALVIYETEEKSIPKAAKRARQEQIADILNVKRYDGHAPRYLWDRVVRHGASSKERADANKMYSDMTAEAKAALYAWLMDSIT